jgi:hypothetical protein
MLVFAYRLPFSGCTRMKLKHCTPLGCARPQRRGAINMSLLPSKEFLQEPLACRDAAQTSARAISWFVFRPTSSFTAHDKLKEALIKSDLSAN